MLRTFIFAVLALLASASAQAMTIDKMLQVSRGETDFFELTNNTDLPLFISAQVTEKDISKEQIIETSYTAENVASWKINVSPAKFVLAQGESKVVYINENLCADGQACQRDKDAVFNIGFVPHVYIPKGEKPRSDVGILFGFAPTFVLLADEMDVAYAMDIKPGKEKDQLSVTNTGNTLVTVMVNQCRDAEKEQKCSTYRQVYNGRTVHIDLPLRYKKNRLDIKVLNGNETYAKDYVL